VARRGRKASASPCFESQLTPSQAPHRSSMRAAPAALAEHPPRTRTDELAITAPSPTSGPRSPAPRHAAHPQRGIQRATPPRVRRWRLPLPTAAQARRCRANHAIASLHESPPRASSPEPPDRLAFPSPNVSEDHLRIVQHGSKAFGPPRHAVHRGSKAPGSLRHDVHRGSKRSDRVRTTLGREASRLGSIPHDVQRASKAFGSTRHAVLRGSKALGSIRHDASATF